MMDAQHCQSLRCCYFFRDGLKTILIFRINSVRQTMNIDVAAYVKKYLFQQLLDWLQSLKQFLINVSYHILVAGLTLMALKIYL